MRFSNDLEFIEHSNRRVVLREPPLYSAALLFFVLGSLGVIAFAGRPESRLSEILIVMTASVWLWCLGLVVLFRVDFQRRPERYPFNEVAGVILQKTWRQETA